MRTVFAKITDPNDAPRESLPVYFHAPEGHDPVVASTDASGVFRAELVPEITYRVSVENTVIVDGVTFPAGRPVSVRLWRDG